jgi:uncharacterized protein YjbI with pentapeptide repeats
MARPTAPKAPTIRPVALGRLSAPPDPVESGDHREGELYLDADFADADWEFTTFTSCAFRRVGLPETRLRGAHFVDVTFADLDCPALSAPRTQWQNVELHTSRIGSAELYDTVWKSVELSGSKLGYLNARASTWQDVVFRDCLIDELDLGSATVRRLAFQRCRIETLDVTGATLADVDLREVQLSTVRGLEGLAGAWVTEQQLLELAPLLAAHLRINVG